MGVFPLTRSSLFSPSILTFVTIAIPNWPFWRRSHHTGIEDAVVRLIYKTRRDQIESINSAELHQALKSAHSYTIRPELDSQLARPRLPELGVGKSLDPLEALTTYLDSREDLKDISQQMLAAAEQLIQDNQENLPLKY